MSASSSNNFAFIDGQNLHLRFVELGWKLDHRRFRVYLQEKYGVARAYYFIGHIESNKSLYCALEAAGYSLIFKPVMPVNGVPKGNVDAELVLHAMIEYPNYSRAVIVTSDGDFACLVNYLRDQGKLERVLAPSGAKCSALLRRAAATAIDFLEQARQKIEYVKN